MYVGLTGGIGSGKSTVAAMLVSRGASLIDTDAIARQVTAAGGPAVGAIVQAFGPDILDASGGMDRARMRQRVFDEPAARQALEAIVHPLVRQAARGQASSLLRSSPAAWVVVDVPLLVESGGWASEVDRVWVVDCPPATQAARVRRRNRWSDDAIAGALAAQASRSRRNAVADAVIYNGDGVSLDALRHQVQLLAKRFGL